MKLDYSARQLAIFEKDLIVWLLFEPKSDGDRFGRWPLLFGGGGCAPFELYTSVYFTIAIYREISLQERKAS